VTHAFGFFEGVGLLTLLLLVRLVSPETIHPP